MLAESTYRAIIFAGIYAPAGPIPRKEATGLYNQIAESVFPGVTFRYSPQTKDDKFKVEMVEKQGRRVDSVILDIAKGGNLRVLVTQDWPQASDVACQRLDDVWKAVRGILKPRDMQIAECRIRAQRGVPAPSGLQYVQQNLFGIKAKKMCSLGSVAHASFRCEIKPDFPADHALGAAMRHIIVEPLREDKTAIYLEVMSQWGRRGLQIVDEHSRQAKVVPGPLEVGVELPSRYVREVMEYIEHSLCPFLEEGQ